MTASTPIQADYEALFGTVAAGGKIGFKLQMVTNTGLVGPVLFRDAIVGLRAAEAAETGEEDALQQAA